MNNFRLLKLSFSVKANPGYFSAHAAPGRYPPSGHYSNVFDPFDDNFIKVIVPIFYANLFTIDIAMQADMHYVFSYYDL
jgi:hypothetical protein